MVCLYGMLSDAWFGIPGGSAFWVQGFRSLWAWRLQFRALFVERSLGSARRPKVRPTESSEAAASEQLDRHRALVS